MSMASAPLPLIALDRVSYAYPASTKPALVNLDWQVPARSFTVVVGPSGSGKSTMLRCINGLVPHFTGGRFGGSVTVHGRDTRNHPPRDLGHVVGFVFQDPEAQLITPRVDDELAFGMEQRAVAPATMRKRVEDVLDLLGIAHLRRRDVSTLSGGERQRVAVAAALAMQPEMLVLDEPTSQLDPWGAEDVLAALTRLNDDLGLTVVLAEHRLERVVPHADHLRYLPGNDQLPVDGSPAAVLARMDIDSVPPIVALGRTMDWDPLPLTVKAARIAARNEPRRPNAPAIPRPPAGPPLIEIHGLATGYGPRSVLRGIDVMGRPGELIALMGRNGSGKTTLLRSIIGLHRPVNGRIRIDGEDVTQRDTADLARVVGYVPQRPDALLFALTLREELAFTLRHHGGRGREPDELLHRLGLAHAADRNPRDLSGGERERAALATILAGDPKLLLLDEPTRGMDPRRKRDLGVLLREICSEGGTVIMATHDVELVARIATRVVLLGDGQVIADGHPREVLADSLTFATQINKIYGDTFLTVEDVATGLDATSRAPDHTEHA
jgi:energy-coupling factor transporter ATP-binding protein EcfA2